MLSKLTWCVVVLLALCGIPGFAQNNGNVEKNTRYLALGDSIAFGYRFGVPIDVDTYDGYVEMAARELHMKVANISCFGESSGSFLVSGIPDLGCAQWKQLGLPLKVPYTGTQMDFAMRYLRQNPNVKLVTLNIGGNDLGVLLRDCQGNAACEAAGFPGVLAAYSNHLFKILSQIRAEYQGPIIVLTYYAFNYNDPYTTGGLQALNAITTSLATAFGARIADGFAAFQAAAASYGGDSCSAGLLAAMPGGSCDTHPSAKGYRVLADAVLDVANGKNGLK